MELSALKGEVLESISTLTAGEIPSAWKDETTPEIVSSSVYIKVLDGSYYKFDACEVELSPNEHPSLGLEIHTETDQPSDIFSNLITPILRLPQKISNIMESDSLGEGAISQYKIFLEMGGIVIIRNIYPPMFLGIEIFHESSRP